MEALEEIHLKVQEALYKLEAEDLRKVCGDLPEVQDFDGKTKRQLIRLILNCLESDAVTTLEDGGMAALLSLEDQITGMLEKEGDDAATKKKENQDAETKQQEAMKTLKEAYKKDLAEMEEKFHAQMAKFGDLSVKKKDVTPPTQYRKECKISGQIGSAQQKDRLTYGSLTHQIETALRRGYNEDEIVEAVIRATNPGIPLRSVLEGDKDLTLVRLKAITRSHYQEKGATELFQELSELSQGKVETPQDFVMQAMDLKRKILKASSEAVSGPQYDHQQVQSIFINAIATGMTNDAVRADVRPYLTENTADETLLERLNVAVSLEAKRQQKAGIQKKVKIQTIGKQEDSLQKAPSTSVQDEQISKLSAGLEDLKATVMALHERTNSPRPPTPPKEQDRRPPMWQRGCPTCRESNQGNNCNHCFKCGDSNHYARGCKVSGNGQRSLPGTRK